MTTKDKPIVIVGTGLAGYSLAKEFRKIDLNTPLYLITQDDGHFYSKPQLSTALQQAKTPESLVVTDKNTMQAQLNAEIFTHSTVEAIDTAAQTLVVQTENSRQEISYQSLVLAMGALPRPFPVLENIKHHYRVNSLQDYGFFIEKTAQFDDVAIIGSGLVGCEFANDFVEKFKQITVITPDPHPLYRLVPAQMGERLQTVLSSKGITWHTKSYLQAAKEEQGKVHLELSNGSIINVQGILTAIGLQPNTTLAQKANLHINQGIVVDQYLQTNDPHIYALGDCAEIDGQCRQYVAPILQCARALAQTLCHKPTPVIFPLMPISLKVSSHPVIVHPPRIQEGKWSIEQNEGGVKALFHDTNGHLQGYALSGTQTEHRMECLKILSSTPISV